MSTFEHTPTDTNDGPKFAGQHLVFTAYDSVTTPDRFVIEVYENTLIGTTGTKIGEFYLTPNTNDRVQFDLGNVIEGRLSAPVNATGGGVIHGHDFTSATNALTTTDRAVREYELKLYNYSNGTKDSTPQDTATIGVMPGVCQISDGYLSFKESPYLMASSTAKAFLTDRVGEGEDIEMYMADEDEGIVAIVQPDEFLATDTDVDEFYYSVSQTGGATADQLNFAAGSLTANDNYKVACIGPAQVAQLFGASWNGNWTKIQIEMRTTTNTIRSRHLTIYRDCRPIKHDPVQLTWANTVGGWDYLRFDGRALKTVNSEDKRYRKTVGSYGEADFTFNAYDRQDTPYHVTAREKYALRNQFFTASERDLLQYCLRSKKVMFRVGTGDWLPCTVDTKSYTVQPAASKLFDVSLNIDLAQDIRC